MLCVTYVILVVVNNVKFVCVIIQVNHVLYVKALENLNKIYFQFNNNFRLPKNKKQVTEKNL